MQLEVRWSFWLLGATLLHSLQILLLRNQSQASEKMDGSRAPYLVFFLLTRRRLSDGSAPYVTFTFSLVFEWPFWPTRHRLSDGYDNIRRLTDVCGHIYKKKYIFLIFCRFKRKNPRVVGSNRRILDRNVVVVSGFLSTWNDEMT